MSDEKSVRGRTDAQKIDRVLEEISRFQRKSRDSWGLFATRMVW